MEYGANYYTVKDENLLIVLQKRKLYVIWLWWKRTLILFSGLFTYTSQQKMIYVWFILFIGSQMKNPILYLQELWNNSLVWLIIPRNKFSYDTTMKNNLDSFKNQSDQIYERKKVHICTNHCSLLTSRQACEKKWYQCTFTKICEMNPIRKFRRW